MPLIAVAAYAPATQIITLTITATPVAVNGVVVYAVFRRRPGKPDTLLPTTLAGVTLRTGPVSDGVYALVLRATFPIPYQEDTVPNPQQAPVVSSVDAVIADGELAAAGSAAYDQHAADYLRTGRDGDRPLDRAMICFSRRYEAGALLAESAPEGAHRILRQSLPPQY